MFLSIVSSLFLSGVSAELVLLLAVWRHGDRAPERLPYPNDKNGEEAWPRGWEQLTNLGISQGFELGTFLRKRYAGQLFARDFNRKEVFVQSSDSERAMETGQAVMAGLFPAEGNRVWNASTEWQPTPMHTNGKGREDPLLKPTGVFCPNYEAIRKRDFHRLEMRMDKKYGGLFDWLSAETGMNVSFANVKKLYDVDKEVEE
ncbi:unnamed protein product, partial [Mesorhabditis belari]|uniref:Acid phosphatase n=1 Tax=Mesorhabditis belari TaxID=2138241 RepID=A0AAF3FMF2_9BILA